jgi:hypothetical protein
MTLCLCSEIVEGKQNMKKIKVASGLMGLSVLLVTPVVASAASSTANTTINATIASTISISSGTTVAIALTPTAGGVVSSASDAVSVSTNNVLGYTLSFSDSDTVTNMVSGANTIGAHTGTQAAPTALAVNKWGYAVGGVGAFDATYATETNSGASTSKWAGVPSSAAPNTLKTTATTATADTTTVWYGVKANSSQPNGVYTDQVTYTATTN